MLAIHYAIQNEVIAARYGNSPRVGFVAHPLAGSGIERFAQIENALRSSETLICRGKWLPV